MNPHNDDRLYNREPLATIRLKPRGTIDVDRMFSIVGCIVIMVLCAGFLLYCLNPQSWSM